MQYLDEQELIALRATLQAFIESNKAPKKWKPSNLARGVLHGEVQVYKKVLVLLPVPLSERVAEGEEL